MFSLILAAAVATAAPSPVLVDNPYSCPTSALWAIPSGSEAHPYECVAVDLGEQVADPSHMPKPHAAPVRHVVVRHVVVRHVVVRHVVVHHVARHTAKRHHVVKHAAKHARRAGA